MEKLSKRITYNDFHQRTFANYQKIRKKELPLREPDFISPSGSKYWFGNKSIIRQANHWGRDIASCAWLLNGCLSNDNKGIKQGICKLSEFIRSDGTFDLKIGNKYRVIKAVLIKKGRGAMETEEKIGRYKKSTNTGHSFDSFRVGHATLVCIQKM